MKADYIVVRFGELTTKGKNRKLFTQKLLKNTKEILYEFPELEYKLQYDRMYIHLNGADHNSINEKLKTVFGIYSFSNAFNIKLLSPKIQGISIFFCIISFIDIGLE